MACVYVCVSLCLVCGLDELISSTKQLCVYDLDLYQSAVLFLLRHVDLAVTESGNAYKTREKKRKEKELGLVKSVW